MSFRTHENNAFAILVTKSRTEVYLTKEEYEGTYALMTTPNNGFTATALDDGSIISLPSIERIEVLPKKPEYNEKQIDTEDPYRQNDENEMRRKKQNWESFRKNLHDSGIYQKIGLQE